MFVYQWQWLSEGGLFNFRKRIVCVGHGINFQNGSEIAHAIQ